MDIITERIKNLREEKGVSKAKMSEILDLDPSNYNRYEKNGKDWTISQIQKIAAAFGVSIGEILNVSDSTDKEIMRQLLKRTKELENTVNLYQERLDTMKALAFSRIKELAYIYFIINDIDGDLNYKNSPLPNSIYEITSNENFWKTDSEAVTFGRLGLIEDDILKEQYNNFIKHSSPLTLEHVSKKAKSFTRIDGQKTTDSTGDDEPPF